MYVCDKSSYDKFELETISSPDGGATFYVAGNIEKGGQMDSIYKITLNS